jgi:hypothetical protein
MRISYLRSERPPMESRSNETMSVKHVSSSQSLEISHSALKIREETSEVPWLLKGERVEIYVPNVRQAEHMTGTW